jgi:hypothetical protein
LAVGSIAVAASPLAKWFDIKNIAFFVAALAGINAFLDPIGRAEGYGVALTGLQLNLDQIALKPVGSKDRMDAILKAQDAEAAGLRDIRGRAIASHPAKPSGTSKPK